MSHDYLINPIGLTVSDRDFHRWLTKGWAGLRGDDSDPSTSEGVARSGLANLVMGLTLEDLRTPARPWRGDFVNSAGLGFWESYALPGTEMELESRLQGNLGVYLGNYVAIMCVAFVCVMFKRPFALLAMVALVKCWDLFLKYRRRPDVNVYSTTFQYMSWGFQMLSALVVILSQVLLALVVAALLGGAVVVGHAACRRPPDPFWISNPHLQPQRSQSVITQGDGRRRQITRRATTGSL
ncbi:hypothetical protein KFL_000270280 [Klebsormidium nitens]|uniref:PRA1 family protein n=1 Tax=Klebsormidium nitens TaxID=105231 RepID=A0A1Y1HPZ3_KLENI|nr:hypothetical protein KFL_000270280 [Klebsormidium nitens]|eukprot:GAQ79269.1 hypothetical protein KFL_000270280 [Klebsormidium nitens]